MFSKRHFKTHLHLCILQLSEPKIWSIVTHWRLEKASYVTSSSRFLPTCDEKLPECFIQKSEDSKVKEPRSPAAERDLGSAILTVAITLWLPPPGEEFTNQIGTFNPQLAEKCQKELLGRLSDMQNESVAKASDVSRLSSRMIASLPAHPLRQWEIRGPQALCFTGIWIHASEWCGQKKRYSPNHCKSVSKRSSFDSPAPWRSPSLRGAGHGLPAAAGPVSSVCVP